MSNSQSTSVPQTTKKNLLKIVSILSATSQSNNSVPHWKHESLEKSSGSPPKSTICCSSDNKKKKTVQLVCLWKTWRLFFIILWLCFCSRSEGLAEKGELNNRTIANDKIKKSAISNASRSIRIEISNKIHSVCSNFHLKKCSFFNFSFNINK